MLESLPPRASLLGLPAELRLEIYAQLAHTLHTHIVHPSNDAEWLLNDHGYIQKLCSFTDARFPQLCIKPRFSGLHPTQDLCRYETDSTQHIFAIRQTCRLIFSETTGVFDKGTTKSSQTSLSIPVGHRDFNFLPQGFAKIQHIRRITLMEMPNNMYCYDDFICHLENSAPRLTGLQSIAVQSPIPHYKFKVKRRKQAALFSPETTWTNLKIVKKLDEIFGTRVLIVLDAWVCYKPRHVLYKGNGTNDEMVIITGVLWPGVENRKQSCEVRREEVVTVDNEAGAGEGVGEEWKQYWRAKGLAYSWRGN